jgi:hypothetical protein
VNNAGFTNIQTRVNTTFGASGTALGLGTVDTTQTTYIILAANIAVATDWLLLQNATVEVLPGA